MRVSSKASTQVVNRMEPAYGKNTSRGKLVAMKTVFFLVLCSGALALSQEAAPVEIELMTHAEIYSAIHQQGKTTVIIYNGGTEQRGPHAVLGGHTFMARATSAAIARKLGNTLVAPVLP